MPLAPIPEGRVFTPPGDVMYKGSKIKRKLKKILAKNADKKAVKSHTRDALDKAIRKDLGYKPPSRASQALSWIGTKINPRSKVAPIAAVWDDNDWDCEAEGNLESCACIGPLLCNPETSTGTPGWQEPKTNIAVKGRKIKFALTKRPVRLAKVCAQKVRKRSMDGDVFNDIQNKDRFYEALGA